MVSPHDLEDYKWKKGDFKAPDENYINVTDTVAMPYLRAFANNYVPWVSPSYPHSKWNEEPDFNASELATGRKCIEWLRTIRDQPKTETKPFSPAKLLNKPQEKPVPHKTIASHAMFHVEHLSFI